ncbi:hypothetical protein DSO57_1000049 [Entomophthora muscae]|uniref:Uncharacterized protein n=1 Tax=Entomophthora muscae TaxID=34485 RepID=A0ACC2SM21_9FUNG|nr:hypothetical protein DSO57_1000049 [Entomophthora muscae]
MFLQVSPHFLHIFTLYNLPVACFLPLSTISAKLHPLSQQFLCPVSALSGSSLTQPLFNKFTDQTLSPNQVFLILHPLLPSASSSSFISLSFLVYHLVLSSQSARPHYEPPRLHLVRIDNSSSLETQAQEQESNLNPGFLQATRPVDRRTARLCFSGIKPLQADTENVGPCSKTGQTKEIIAPNRRLIIAPNRGTEATTISFMNLKPTPMTNQELSQESGMGPQPGPMNTTLKKDNQVVKLRFLTNERTPGPSTILLPLDLSTQIPWACLPNALFEIFCPPCPAIFLPLGVPFGPIHFTDYPLKPNYKDYTPEKILELDLLACIQSAVRYNCQDL